MMAWELTLQGKDVPKYLVLQRMLANGRRCADLFALMFAVRGRRAVLYLERFFDATMEFVKRRLGHFA
jgi:hypothetical protein